MMSRRTLSPTLLLLLLATPGFAQEGEGMAMPNPITEHHALLKRMVGTWKWEAIEHTPGEDATKTFSGFQRTTLFGKGIHAVSQIWGTYMDQPFDGLHVFGYSPSQQNYRGLFVTNMGPQPAAQTATYDPETKTFDIQVEMSMGGDQTFRYRQTLVQRDANTWFERMYMPAGDGSEFLSTEMTITRLPKGEKVQPPKMELANKHPELQAFVGRWDCQLSMQMGEETMNWSGTDVTRFICGGNWARTTFKGEFMGQPFEGMSLVGFDPATKTLTSYWMDTMTPEIAKSTGAFDEARKTATFTGSMVGMEGGPATTREVYTVHGKKRRTMEMTTTEANGNASTMRIEYTRKARKKKDE